MLLMTDCEAAQANDASSRAQETRLRPINVSNNQFIANHHNDESVLQTRNYTINSSNVLPLLLLIWGLFGGLHNLKLYTHHLPVHSHLCSS